MREEKLKLNFKETQKFYEYIQGKAPEGYQINSKPNLNEETAFSIIYILQEKFHIIPDHFERCQNCGILFDTEKGGHIIEPDSDLIKEGRVYQDLSDIPEFYGDFCSNSCLLESANKYRKTGELPTACEED